MLASIHFVPEPRPKSARLARAEALIWLRIAERELERNGPEQMDRDEATARDKVISSLALNPTDSCLWLMLYSIEVLRNGFDPRAVGFLTQSYATGPLEGWVALRRNSVALAAFESLSEVMQTSVVSEFAGLVDSDFTDAAALNLIGVGWEWRGRLLSGLVNVDLIPREAFAKRVARDGVTISVPGIQLDERWWR
ncbi:hypothetical protein [Bradyrhizobium sp. Y36]|uniref:hypothetical protein n=1 Tax=Bradyrhizobium sp. Y36 TaxID=2035447 RepID=UPI0011775EA3|nr:hypothetical protein [Bradyrhizobium sp. Y36]